MIGFQDKVLIFQDELTVVAGQWHCDSDRGLETWREYSQQFAALFIDKQYWGYPDA